jgi:hypothetical protein
MKILDFENIKTVNDLNAKQTITLLRIGTIEKSRKDLGPNGLRLYKELELSRTPICYQNQVRAQQQKY